MKTINVVLIVLLLVILLNINFNDDTKIVRPVKIENQVDTLELVDPKGVISVAQEDIMLENRGKPVRVMGNFPIPQTTTRHKSLSTNYPEDLSIITQGASLNNPDVIVEIRDNGVAYQESHFPEYYKKDTLSANTIGSTEYKFAEVDNLKSSYAWSDKNVSQYPSFYSSQLKDEITNVGAFFDVNNNFVDSTKPRATALTGDVCFRTSEGEHVCLDGSRNYNPPPALISNKNNCGFLNSIGLLEFSNKVKEDGERVNNGGFLYGNVKGSKKHNEVYSKPIQPEVLTCQI
jgi:hypothetical protein